MGEKGEVMRTVDVTGHRSLLSQAPHFLCTIPRILQPKPETMKARLYEALYILPPVDW